MAKKKPRTLDIGANGEIRLPEDAMRTLDVAPGEKLEISVDTRRKMIRLERYVDDPWAEAMKTKEEKGFEDLASEQDKRDAAASELFDRKLKDPPKDKKRPEDDPDMWR